MSLEQQVAALVTASNNLTGVVAGKQADIDAKVAAKINDLEQWRSQNIALMPPNLIDNAHMMNLNDKGVPLGFSVYGDGAIIQAVHPYTKGYEGPYVDTKPANAANSPVEATQDKPYWYGSYNMGARSGRGGLSGGWGGQTTGHIIRVTTPNTKGANGQFRAVFTGAKLPVELSAVYFSAWFYIEKGSIGLGVDAGYTGNNNFYPGAVVIDKKMTAASPDGWYRYSGIIGVSQVTSLGANQMCIGFGEGETEFYMALPYIGVPFNANFMVG
ncbi:hypothetical protein [Chromobacterium paludis]|uniref:Uncharacterized protein n=1 Tax=Chromobacterium paludis TaxID=2605945 RepID=A0A5C1DJX8_9NEIS|nr:hypothetical protein [Chromobacterium paludis]QEL57046.1 hypothetical protein FYK34_16500 [Chromobacterium paludis]